MIDFDQNLIKASVCWLSNDVLNLNCQQVFEVRWIHAHDAHSNTHFPIRRDSFCRTQGTSERIHPMESQNQSYARILALPCSV